MTTVEDYNEAMRKLEDWHKFTTYVQPLLNVIKGRVAYLEGAIERYEKHIASGPHTYREEPFVKVANSTVDSVPASCNEDAFFAGKYLTKPVMTLRPRGIKVQIEPETLLDTSSVQSTQHLGGTDGEQARGHDEVPQKSDRLHIDYLRDLLEMIRLDIEWERNEAHRKDTDRLKGSGYEMLANSKRAWQLDAVWDFVKRFNKALG
jgi:hypothetical protein